MEKLKHYFQYKFQKIYTGIENQLTCYRNSYLHYMHSVRNNMNT